MTPYETQLSSEIARLRSAVKVQALLFLLLCVVGAARTAFPQGFRAGDLALDLHRRTLEIRLTGGSR